MSKNICLKYKISEEELDTIIHKLLDEVPADKLSLKEADVILDLLRYGDIDKGNSLKEFENLCFRLSNIFISCLDCEKCLAKDICKYKNNTDVNLFECFYNLTNLMKAVNLSGMGETLKKSAVKEYVEKTLPNSELFKELLQQLKEINDEDL